MRIVQRFCQIDQVVEIGTICKVLGKTHAGWEGSVHRLYTLARDQ
jgi:hypothetical protein